MVLSVKVAAWVDAFSMTPAPASAARVPLLPKRRKVAAAPREPIRTVAPRAEGLPSATVPSPAKSDPVYAVFVPEMVSVPKPVLVTLPNPAPRFAERTEALVPATSTAPPERVPLERVPSLSLIAEKALVVPERLTDPSIWSVPDKEPLELKTPDTPLRMSKRGVVTAASMLSV